MKSSVANRYLAFTLAEVMVAMSVFLIIVTLAMSVVIAVAKLNVKTDSKDLLNGDYRAMTRVLGDLGRTANSFRIYSDFAMGHRNAANDALGVGVAGDFLVLVTYSTSDIGAAPNSQRIGRIVGVYRDGTGSGPEKLRWFDSDRHNWGQSFSNASPAPANTLVEDLLPGTSYNGAVLAELTQGTTGGGFGSTRGLFLNLNTVSYMLNGVVYRNASGNATNAMGGQDSRSAYNLIVTPRS